MGLLSAIDVACLDVRHRGARLEDLASIDTHEVGHGDFGSHVLGGRVVDFRSLLSQDEDKYDLPVRHFNQSRPAIGRKRLFLLDAYGKAGGLQRCTHFGKAQLATRGAGCKLDVFQQVGGGNFGAQ